MRILKKYLDCNVRCESCDVNKDCNGIKHCLVYQYCLNLLSHDNHKTMTVTQSETSNKMAASPTPSEDGVTGAHNESALRALMKRTGCPIQQSNGQRRFGPPPNWTGEIPPRGMTNNVLFESIQFYNTLHSITLSIQMEYLCTLIM